MHKILLDFKSKKLAMINKNRDFFQYNNGNLVYIILPVTSQLCTDSRKVMIKYVGPVVIYKIKDPHKYLLMTLDGKILRGTLWTWEVKASKHKNKSEMFKILHNWSRSQIWDLKFRRWINLEGAFVHKEKISNCTEYIKYIDIHTYLLI